MTVRVLSLLWGFSGGVGRYAIQLDGMNRLADLRLDTACIVSPRWNCDLDPLRAIGASLIEVRSRLDLSWIGRTAALIDRLAPDLVFVHGHNGPVVARLCARRLRRNIRLVCSNHGPYTAPVLWKRAVSPLFNRAAEFVYRRRAAGILAVAHAAKAYLVGRGVPESRITVIHNGIPAINANGSLDRPRAGIPDDAFVIGLASRLVAIKGIQYLLEAMPAIAAAVPKARVVIVGDGPSEATLKAQCAKRGVADRVHFAGYQSDAPAWLGLFDVFALPSLSENHSIALLEAMRAGLPIVATNVGGNGESVEDGREGLLVEARDPRALERAVVRLALDADLRARLGRAARRRFERDFTLQRSLERTTQWLLDLHKDGPSS